MWSLLIIVLGEPWFFIYPEGRFCLPEMQDGSLEHFHSFENSIILAVRHSNDMIVTPEQRTRRVDLKILGVILLVFVVKKPVRLFVPCSSFDENSERLQDIRRGWFLRIGFFMGVLAEVNKTFKRGIFNEAAILCQSSLHEN